MKYGLTVLFIISSQISCSESEETGSENPVLAVKSDLPKKKITEKSIHNNKEKLPTQIIPKNPGRKDTGNIKELPPLKTGEKLHLDVGYGPAPYKVVEVMVEEAKIKKSDLLYDLGCGDGRIVNIISKKTGCTGVGIDLDPKRVEQSKKNAIRMGLTNTVKIYRQNIFNIDLSSATVAAMYLNQKTNLKIRSKILREMRPGTRIISLNHTMGEWRSDIRRKVGRHRVLIWFIPANVYNEWEYILDWNKELKRIKLNIYQDFQEFTGNALINGKKYKLYNRSLQGKKIAFSVSIPVEGKKSKLLFSGTVEGSKVVGIFKTNDKTHSFIGTAMGKFRKFYKNLKQKKS
ncbi:MAG: methyltransferase domain-containing protein [Deltaproteobacteria bacterium]|nr:methyltransferase domain-containing protein [Deltaproteobacteria bacterium]